MGKHKPLPQPPPRPDTVHSDGAKGLLVIIPQWNCAIGKSGTWYRWAEGDRAEKGLVITEAIKNEQQSTNEPQWQTSIYHFGERRVFVPLGSDEITQNLARQSADCHRRV